MARNIPQLRPITAFEYKHLQTVFQLFCPGTSLCFASCFTLLHIASHCDCNFGTCRWCKRAFRRILRGGTRCARCVKPRVRRICRLTGLGPSLQQRRFFCQHCWQPWRWQVGNLLLHSVAVALQFQVTCGQQGVSQLHFDVANGPDPKRFFLPPFWQRSDAHSM